MLKNFLLLLILILFQWFFAYSNEYVNFNHDGHQVELIKVELDGDYKIVTSLSSNGDSLKDLVDDVGGVSGVNGSYFCPADYSHCNGTNFTDTYRVFNSQHKSKYGKDLGARGLFGFDKGGDPLFILNNLGYVDGINRNHNEYKFDNLKYGLANFPVLLLEGENVVGESSSIFDEKMKEVGVKSFICSRDDNNTVLMGSVSNVNIESLSNFLKNSLQCYNAINLDSGGSLGMVHNNEIKRQSGREVMDAFVIIEKDDYSLEYTENKNSKYLGNSLGGNYTSKNGKLFYNNKKLYSADLNSFEYLGDSYGKDNSYVYYKGEVIKINWAKDPEVVQEGYSTKRADASSFEKLDNGYYKDKNYIYKAGKAIKGKNPENISEFQKNENSFKNLSKTKKTIANNFFSKLKEVISKKTSNIKEKKELYKYVASTIKKASTDRNYDDRLMLDYIRYLCYQEYKK